MPVVTVGSVSATTEHEAQWLSPPHSHREPPNLSDLGCHDPGDRPMVHRSLQGDVF